MSPPPLPHRAIQSPLLPLQPPIWARQCLPRNNLGLQFLRRPGIHWLAAGSDRPLCLSPALNNLAPGSPSLPALLGTVSLIQSTVPCPLARPLTVRLGTRPRPLLAPGVPDSANAFCVPKVFRFFSQGSNEYAYVLDRCYYACMRRE